MQTIVTVESLVIVRHWATPTENQDVLLRSGRKVDTVLWSHGWTVSENVNVVILAVFHDIDKFQTAKPES